MAVQQNSSMFPLSFPFIWILKKLPTFSACPVCSSPGRAIAPRCRMWNLLDARDVSKPMGAYLFHFFPHCGLSGRTTSSETSGRSSHGGPRAAQVDPACSHSCYTEGPSLAWTFSPIMHTRQTKTKRCISSRLCRSAHYGPADPQRMTSSF